MAQASLGGSSSTKGYITQGMTGPEVLELQKKLKAEGFDPGPLDGKFGDLTAAALQDYQRGRGLEPDAVVGPLTRNALSLTSASPSATPGAVTTPLSTKAVTVKEDPALRYKTGPVAPEATVPRPITVKEDPALRYKTGPVAPEATVAKPVTVKEDPALRYKTGPVAPEVAVTPTPVTVKEDPALRYKTGPVAPEVAIPAATPQPTVAPQPAPAIPTPVTPKAVAPTPQPVVPQAVVPQTVAPTTPQAVAPTLPAPVGQNANISGLLNLPAGTQFTAPTVATPQIATPTFTTPGAIPQAPQQQVTPERQALLAQLNRLQEMNAPQATVPQFEYQAQPALTYEEAQRRAAAQLNPQYQEAMTDRMAGLSTQLRQTGMYGQAPTIPITQEAMARIEAARMGAVGAQANTLMSQASQEALQRQQLAQSQWAQETSLSLQAQGMNADEAQRKVANILAVASAVDQQRAQEASLTGYYGGAPTMQRAGMEAELTGTYGGSPTWARQAQQAQLALSAQQAQAQAQMQAQQQAWTQQVQQAGLTGVYGGAPTLEARQAQAAAAQADLAAQQRAQEFGWQRTAQEAGLTGTYSGAPTLAARQYESEAQRAQAAQDWQRQYQSGSLAQQQREFDWQKQYQQGQLDVVQGQAAAKPTSDVNLRETALQMAQKDPQWLEAYTDEKRQAIISFYMAQLQGQAQTGVVDNTVDWAAQGGYAK